MVVVHGSPAWRGQAYHAEDRLQSSRFRGNSEAVAKRIGQLGGKTSERRTKYINVGFSAPEDAGTRPANEGRANGSARMVSPQPQKHKPCSMQAVTAHVSDGDMRDRWRIAWASCRYAGRLQIGSNRNTIDLSFKQGVPSNRCSPLGLGLSQLLIPSRRTLR
jgi:hypothetical protein